MGFVAFLSRKTHLMALVVAVMAGLLSTTSVASAAAVVEENHNDDRSSSSLQRLRVRPQPFHVGAGNSHATKSSSSSEFILDAMRVTNKDQEKKLTSERTKAEELKNRMDLQERQQKEDEELLAKLVQNNEQQQIAGRYLESSMSMDMGRFLQSMSM